MRRSELLEEREDSRAVLVGLCEHGLRSLEQHVVLRVVRHLLRHIRIANRGLGVLNVLGRRREVGARVVQASLDCADVRLLIKSLLERRLECVDCSVCLLLRLNAENLTIRTLHAECERAHIGHADLDRLVCLDARLEDESIVLGLVLCADTLVERIESIVRRLADCARVVRDRDRERGDLVGRARAGCIDRESRLIIRRVDAVLRLVKTDESLVLRAADESCARERLRAVERRALDNVGETIRTNRERRRVGATLTDIGDRDVIRRLNVEALIRAALEIRQSRAPHRSRAQCVVRERRAGCIALRIARAIDEVLAVVRCKRVVVDLVNHLVDLFLDRAAILVRVRVVRCVDRLLLEGLEDLDRAGDSALSGAHHAVAVLRVLVVLIERTDLDAHTLRDGIAGSIIAGAVDLHARGDLLKALRECRLVLVQDVERVDRRHVVLNYHCHV